MAIKDNPEVIENLLRGFLFSLGSNFSLYLSSKPTNMLNLNYCVYILFSLKDQKMYIGYTTNLEQRIANHNAGGTISTAKRRPLKLIFCEYYLSKRDAMRREKYFKTTAGKKGLKLMLRETLGQGRIEANSADNKS